MLKNNLRKTKILGITALLPVISFAQTPCVGKVCIFGKEICATDPCKLSHVMPAIETLIRFLAIDIAIPLAVVAISFAGVKMIMSEGNAGEYDKAKKIIWNALKGVFFALTAYLIVKAIIFGLSGKTPEQVIDVINK